MTNINVQEDFNDEIDLMELFKLLLDNLLLIIGLGVLGFALAFGYTKFLVEPTYSSVSTVYIQPTVKDNQVVASDITTNQKLTTTYTEIAKSNTVLSQVLPYFSNDLTKKQMASAISVRSIGETQIISFTAVTTDPELSARLVNRVVDVFVNEVKEIMAIDNLTIIDRAIVNEDKVGPNTTMNSAIGLILGVMIGVGIAFLKMMLNRTIQTRVEAERLLGIPVLGEIYYNE